MRASSARTSPGAAARLEFAVEQPPERRVVARRPRETVVDVDAVAVLGHEAGVFEQAEMPRHARLRQPEDAGELGDVEAVGGERPQQPEAGGVAEHAEEGGDVCISTNLTVMI